VYFEEAGIKNDKTIIFIHGAMWPRHFCRQEVLSDKYHTVFFHMNGHGQEFTHRFKREDIVQNISDYIKNNNIGKPHIVGFSLGTQISMQLADKYPHLIDKIALISPLTDASETDIAKIKFTMKMLANLAKLTPVAKIAASVLKIEESCKKDLYDEIKNQNITELAEDIMEERLNLKDLKNIEKIDNEFYLAVGVKDMDCFIETGKKLKSVLKNSILQIYDTGHNIPIFAYKKLNNDLRLFFNDEKIANKN